MNMRKLKLRGDKRAISPVITTVLLILIVIILAVIILLWARGFIKEKIMKFDAPIERSCENVKIQVALTDDARTISLTNQGNVALYKLGARLSGEGGSKIIESTNKNFLQGFSGIISYDEDLTGKVEAVPILLGKTEKSGEVQQFPCPSDYWQTVE